MSSQGRLFLLDSISGASHIDIELLRDGSAFFIAPGVVNGFRVFTQNKFSGIRMVAAPGVAVSFFISDEDIQIGSAIISGTVAVSNFTDNGLTNTQLRAAPVPVEVLAHNTAAIATTGVDQLGGDFKGKWIVPPGGVICLAALGAAAAAAGFSSTLTWEEVPV